MVIGRRPEISRDEVPLLRPPTKRHIQSRGSGSQNTAMPYTPRLFHDLPSHTAYARFNKRLAVLITSNVGTMTCFWLFCVISLLGAARGVGGGPCHLSDCRLDR